MYVIVMEGSIPLEAAKEKCDRVEIIWTERKVEIPVGMEQLDAEIVIPGLAVEGQTARQVVVYHNVNLRVLED